MSRALAPGVPRAGVSAVATALLLSISAFARAQPMAPAPGGLLRADEKPAALKDIGIDQRLNEPVPLTLAFRDEAGRPVHLGDYFGKHPVIVALVYYNCPMLCTQVLNGMVSALRVLPLSAERDFEVVVVSFDPREKPADAAAKRNAYLARYQRPEGDGGWHFLTGDEAAINALARAVGFRFRYDRALDQFAHASALYVLTPEGRLSHYFYGIEYAPRDLRLSLLEASEGRIGSPVDRVLLYCFHYDPKSGKYGAAVVNIVRLAGLATLLALSASLFFLSRRERRLRPIRGETR
ncbi:MAG TPA: SCO family protein [Thermoanaerobaculia bacterium]|nr:SCO family protein [Thermoanaerobaculia bacterium]